MVFLLVLMLAALPIMKAQEKSGDWVGSTVLTKSVERLTSDSVVQCEARVVFSADGRCVCVLLDSCIFSFVLVDGAWVEVRAPSRVSWVASGQDGRQIVWQGGDGISCSEINANEWSRIGVPWQLSELDVAWLCRAGKSMSWSGGSVVGSAGGIRFVDWQKREWRDISGDLCLDLCSSGAAGGVLALVSRGVEPWGSSVIVELDENGRCVRELGADGVCAIDLMRDRTVVMAGSSGICALDLSSKADSKLIYGEAVSDCVCAGGWTWLISKNELLRLGGASGGVKAVTRSGGWKACDLYAHQGAGGSVVLVVLRDRKREDSMDWKLRPMTLDVTIYRAPTESK